MLIRVHVHRITAIDVAHIAERAFAGALVQIHCAGIKIAASAVGDRGDEQVVIALRDAAAAIAVAAVGDAGIAQLRPGRGSAIRRFPDAAIGRCAGDKPGEQLVGSRIKCQLAAIDWASAEISAVGRAVGQVQCRGRRLIGHACPGLATIR